MTVSPNWPQSTGHQRGDALGRASIGLAGLGAVLLAGRSVGVNAPPCPFRTITGLPCPGCGMTRLADAVAHGQGAVAVAADPAGVALLAAIAVVAAIVVTARLRGRPVPRWLGGPAMLVSLTAIVVAHWATTIVTGVPLT